MLIKKNVLIEKKNTLPKKFLGNVFRKSTNFNLSTYWSLKTKTFLLELGQFHRYAGVPSCYFGVMGTIFLNATRYLIFKSIKYPLKLFFTNSDSRLDHALKSITYLMKTPRMLGRPCLASLQEFSSKDTQTFIRLDHLRDDKNMIDCYDRKMIFFSGK